MNEKEKNVPTEAVAKLVEVKWEPREKLLNFGYDPEKDTKKIADLRRWYRCSFCGLSAEVRPHAPLLNDEWKTWKALPMRLCFYCAQIQEAIRERIKSYDLQDGN